MLLITLFRKGGMINMHQLTSANEFCVDFGCVALSNGSMDVSHSLHAQGQRHGGWLSLLGSVASQKSLTNLHFILVLDTTFHIQTQKEHKLFD